ncbi:MAG: TonB-dependent receptor [Gemmatimonadota bacterium]
MMLSAVALLGLLTTGLGAQQQPVTPAATPASTGRVTGRVIDRETGRPLQGVRVSIVGLPGVVESDLDGRYRTAQLPIGQYGVRAASIGYRPSQRDSIRVTLGQAVTVDFALNVQVVELEELSVVSDIPAAPKTDAGLLAAQQAAPSASDGISAEAISRNPDANGGDVIRRVTGIAVFDKKFVVVRGLNERYSNTLLNGVDLPSPEPLKKVVPLDIFPASLLESIITTKSATPDKPGDFAGGSVEVKTKEFPENPVLQISTTQGFNSQSTFRAFAEGPRSFQDALGFGANSRRPLSTVFREPAGGSPLDERTTESFRDVWRGRQVSAGPNLGLGFNLGGQFGETRPLGYVLALTYSNKRSFTPDKLGAFFVSADQKIPSAALQADESSTEVEWGAIANLSWRLGSNKFGFKNLLTRDAEELLAQGNGLQDEQGAQFRYFGVQYVERTLFQSQLSGEHLLPFLFGSRLEWKGTYARAIRDEPDNRQARYVGVGSSASLSEVAARSDFSVRYLNDRILSGQGDLSIPLSLRHSGDAQFKIGGLFRAKNRNFKASNAVIAIAQTPEAQAVARLDPEEAFAPENMGNSLFLTKNSVNLTSRYTAKDDLTAAYGMLDLPLLPFARLVGGVRFEDWRLHVVTPVRADSQLTTARHNPDLLWSANLTLALSESMNLRFAGFRSVTRPDPRDLSLDAYRPVGSECTVGGDTSVVESKIINADARWEFYPRSGEIFAVSGFYKHFTDPLVEVIGPFGSAACSSRPANGQTARSYGVELEARHALDFLPGTLKYLSLGFNATFLGSDIQLDERRYGAKKPGLDLQGQSPFLLNGGLTYSNPVSRTSASLLYNYFADRIARYGGNADPDRVPPNVIERARYSLDAKVSQSFGGLKLSVGATNLTNRQPRFVLEGTDLVTRTYTIGTSWSVGVSYDIY